MNIGEICNPSVVIINRDESALEAARLMREYHVGDVVIIDEVNDKKIPVGIVTDRDLAVEIIAQEVDPESVEVADLFMRQELIIASVNDDIESVLKKMKSHAIRRIPVIETDGSLAGIVTMDDLLDIFAEDFTGVARLIDRQGRA